MGAAGPQLAFVWQAQGTEPSGGAAARVGFAGRGWLSCGKRKEQSLLEELLPLGRGWLSCGRRKTQSLLEELLYAWAPLGRGWLLCGRRAFVGKVRYTEPQELLRAWAPLGRGWLLCGRRGFV